MTGAPDSIRSRTSRSLARTSVGLPAHSLPTGDLRSRHQPGDVTMGAPGAAAGGTNRWMVLRRATGKRPGEWPADHVARPLDLAMTFGVDPSAAGFCPMLDPLPSIDLVTAEAAAAALEIPMVERAMSLGGVLDARSFFASANRPEFLACEVPAGNLVSNARSLARLHAATVGEVDGLQLLDPATVRDAGRCSVRAASVMTGRRAPGLRTPGGAGRLRLPDEPSRWRARRPGERALPCLDVLSVSGPSSLGGPDRTRPPPVPRPTQDTEDLMALVRSVADEELASRVEQHERARLVTMLIENDYLDGEVIRMDGALRMAAR